MNLFPWSSHCEMRISKVTLWDFLHVKGDSVRATDEHAVCRGTTIKNGISTEEEGQKD